MPEENMENTKLLPLGTEQGLEETEYPSFDLCLGENMVSPLVAQHRQWLKTIRHEVPNPKIPFKVAVYIRFFNQTKYRDEEYLERNKEVFRATLAQYPMWEFVGFYIDNGSTAPYMENSTAWSELLSCLLYTSCPYKYEPRDAFLPMIDQSTVDDSTERWLDGIEEKVDYKAWLCGHWHIEKKIDKLRFLFHDVVSLEMIKRGFK